MTRTEKLKQIARDEGIVLTPRGEPLYARDMKRWREIQQRDLRTEEQREIDAIEDAMRPLR